MYKPEFENLKFHKFGLWKGQHRSFRGTYHKEAYKLSATFVARQKLP
jgi:hypothetical protein